MSQTLKKILLSIVILLILDSIYLSMNYRLFADTVVNIQRVVMQVKPAGAFFVYLFIAFILNYFIILKNLFKLLDNITSPILACDKYLIFKFCVNQ
jgi:uncharacterized membrane protein